MSKVMLITGASSGIGRATAKAAARADYKLILTARRVELIDELVKEFGDDNAIAIPADVTDYDALEDVVEKGVAKFGKLDIAYANAGAGSSSSGTETGDPKEWGKMVNVNIMGLLYTAKLTLPHLRKTSGHFIMTGSAAGRITLKGSVYGATKWFVHGFANNLAEEMKEWHGRCTTIAPGMVNTPFFDEPVPEKLQPEDVADAVIYATQADQGANVREIFLMPTH